MAKPNHGAKILLIDIETFPNIGFTWSKWQTDVIQFTQEWCLATVAWKWLGKPVRAAALPDYKGYRAGSYDDRELTRVVWGLLDEADIAIAHNGDQFDFRKMNARFIAHGMPPPAPYKTIDTKKVVKSVAAFNSNKLDDLGEALHIGRKIKTDFSLWLGCINGDPKQWAKMVKYNKMDVELLERLYLRVLPYIKQHPNLGVYLERAVCPCCGGGNLHNRGYAVAVGRKYRKMQCQDCGKWSREVISRKKATYANI